MGLLRRLADEERGSEDVFYALFIAGAFIVVLVLGALFLLARFIEFPL